MDEGRARKALRIPLYGLIFTRELGEHQPDPAVVARFREDYSDEELREIVAGLEWAVAHPDFELGSLLPGLTLSDAELHRYLKRLLDQLGTEG